MDRLAVLHALIQALEALPEDDRTIVVGRFFDGLTATEIGARLGMPPATIRSRLRRTLARLRSTLDTRFDGERVLWAGAVVSPGTMLGETTLAAGTVLAWLSAAKVVVVVVAAVLGVAVWFGTRSPQAPEPAGHPVSANAQGDDKRPANAPAASDSPAQRLWAARRDRIVASNPSAANDPAPNEPSPDSESATDAAMHAQSQAFQDCIGDLGIPLVGASILRSEIRGAPDVGTIYEGLDIVGDTETHPELIECVQEHMYSYLGDAPDESFSAVRTVTTLGARPENLDDDAWAQRMFDTIVTAHLAEVDACAEGLPGPLAATLTLSFEDEPAASEVEVDAIDLPEAVVACITDEARAWMFPRVYLADRAFDRQLVLGASG